MKQLKKIYWKRIGVIGISCFMLLWSCLLTGCGIGKGDSGKPAACTISIDCQTILDNIGDLKETKKEFVPEDGWILPEMEVKFTTGDTVFDILKKICGEKNIQLSSKYTPLYKSYYVEGINQLYEFDCGKNSGWMESFLIMGRPVISQKTEIRLNGSIPAILEVMLETHTKIRSKEIVKSS